MNYWDVAWWLVYCKENGPFNRLDPSKWVCSPEPAYDSAHVRTSYDATHGALKVTSTAEPGHPDFPSLTTDPSPKTAFVAFLGDAPERYDTIQDAFFWKRHSQTSGAHTD